MIHLRLLFCATCVMLLHACSPADTRTAIAPEAAAIKPLLPGMAAPAFRVRSADGSVYEFASGPRARPLVLTFFRGTWCPYCTRYLWEMRAAEQRLLDLGYELVFISADRPEKLAPYLEEKDLAYTLLSDNDLVAARAFGVAFQVDDAYLQKLLEHDIDIEDASGRTHHWLPVPATFVIGTDGVIDFQYANPDYKVRVAAEVLITAARDGLDEAS